MKKMTNKVYLEGLLYEHDLQKKKTGPNSKNPGTEYISGTISIATDDAVTNIVPVHYSYVTATTSTGKPDARFTALSDIIDGKVGTVMTVGAENAGKVRIDTSIALNDFYTDRNGETTLVSAKRNEGGFIHTTAILKGEEKDRNTFEVDMVITSATRQEANEEFGRPEKVIVKGAIFDFRNALLPIELSATNEGAMNYFESLGASAKNPVFTKLRGTQISETIKRTITEEGAFGTSVREVTSSRKDFVITWASGEPFVFDDETTITAAELTEAMANRETYLATVKQRADEYKATKVAGPSAFTAPTDAVYNF